MVSSPLKSFSHSRSSSRNSAGQPHSRQASSDLRKNIQGQHPVPSNVQPQQAQPQKNSRITSMDLAKQYETDRAKIVKFCFSKREPDGQFHENYITHVRIIEDSHYPSSRPAPDSNPSHKKHRILILGVKRTGRVRLHKARENKDGTVQIGRTWDLDELTKLEKDPLVPTGFMLYLGKPYYWETTTSKEATVFNTSVINTYMKYTSKVPELVIWDLKTLGITVPANISRNASQSGNVARSTSEKKTSMPAPQRIPSEKGYTNPSSQRLPSSEGANKSLVIPKSRQDTNAPSQVPPLQNSSQFAALKQKFPEDPTPPLAIVPPKQSKFVPNKNAVLSSSSNNLPESRIPSHSQQQQQQQAQQQPQLQLQQQQQQQAQYQAQLQAQQQAQQQLLQKQKEVAQQPSHPSAPLSSGRSFADRAASNSVEYSSSPALSSSSVPAAETFARRSGIEDTPIVKSNIVAAPSAVNNASLTGDSSGSSLRRIESINSVTFKKNDIKYADVEKETDDIAYKGQSRNGNENRDYEEEEDDDDGYDVTNYYGDATPEPEIPSSEFAGESVASVDATKSIDPRVAKYVAQPNSVSSETNKASQFVEDLFSNISWSISDDAATLEKKLMRQLVVAENESCQALINIGDDKAELKRSLDSASSECKKLDPLMAFFNVELASFKDEVNQINSKADSVGLINRTVLYKEIASMR